MIVVPTRDEIENRRIAEGTFYDFKREVDLDKKYPGSGKSAKERFVDDVVAFLNGEGGHLIIGVTESDGVWDSYVPLTSDREKTCNRFLQVIQSTITPLPTKIDVVPIDVPGGYILDVRIPPHWKKPYQNSMSGAFYVRAGPRNRVLSVPEIREHFTDLEKMEGDLSRLFDSFRRDLMADDNIASIGRLGSRGISDEDDDGEGARLLIGILPRQHYDRSRKRYEIGKPSQQLTAAFNGGWYPRLRGCAGGFEALTTHERLFLSTDWSVMAWIKHPFDFSRERPDINAFENNLKRYLQSLHDFLNDAGVVGPYAITLAVEGLNEIEGWSRPGMPSEVGDSRPSVVETPMEAQLFGEFVAQVRSALFP